MATASAGPPQRPTRIRAMSWNIFGLEGDALLERTLAVCENIERERPHVVFLQEVIPTTQEIIRKKCSQFQFIPSNEHAYYTAIMLKRDVTECEDSTVIPFESSTMGRNLLKVTAKVHNVECVLMTSHLESLRPCQGERQLQRAFTEMTEADPNRMVLFGGDMNLRDDELAAMGGLPEGICDMWELNGSRPDEEFTWDLQQNDNLEMPGRPPRRRFDRLYVRRSKPTWTMKPVYFELARAKRLEVCEMFPSDHWAIVAHFDTVAR